MELNVILVAERVEIRRVDAEKRDAALDFRQLVEVEEKEKNPVDEFVKTLNLDALTPKDALDILYQLRQLTS